MADSAGVRIDGERVDAPAGRPPAGARTAGARTAGWAPADRAALRRRLLMGLVGVVIAALALSLAVERLRTDSIAGEGRAGLLTGIYPCPPQRACAISAQPSARMWDAAFQAFPEFGQVSTTVVFDARTGRTYSESLTLTDGRIVIRLTVTREPDSVPREMFVDVTAASADGVVVSAIPADGVADRTTTAALSGPEDSLLPVAAAVAWAGTVDLFGD